ncbi:DNA repair protein RecO [Leptolyngbya ohadii]|uniref:DNA repair protein RecO n=1 Tax=Leptolyngbya ohadii TaxID=1962290 RepID=UPI000B59BF7D|nr:DNA repair protein RecO [Leptolyngbya ohadii]
MSGTYKAIGINLKSTPLGESDRLLTILTEEFGLLRAVAPGSRKHKSSLGGRSGLFVVNNLLIVSGKNLDKVIQAETVESFPGLSQDLKKLTAAQYLAEIALYQALSEQSQADLFNLLREHLTRLENLPSIVTLPCLAHAVFHLLALAGIAPQVFRCCITKQEITPDFSDPDWRAGFSSVAGGVVLLSELDNLRSETVALRKAASGSTKILSDRASPSIQAPPELHTQITAIELYLLQQLTKPDLLETLMQADPPAFASNQVWLPIERILRNYAQYHFDRPIRSSTLIDSCFSPASALSLQNL